MSDSELAVVSVDFFAAPILIERAGPSTDGGDTVRDLQLYLNPQAEHLLDWFHITMRLTVMGQMAKSINAMTNRI